MNQTGPHPVLEEAKRLLARGFMPVKVAAGTKRPVAPQWNKIVYTLEQLPGAFSGDCNLGINLGAASGWLVDVDLDCDEAVELQDQYLPSTPAVTGRSSRPRSHRWYIVKGAVTKAYRDPKTKDAIVELRSTGAQTLVGPSTHPDDGDVYDRLEGEPAAVSAETLAACIADLADAVCKKRYGTTAVRPSQQHSPQHRVSGSPPDVGRAQAYLDAMPPAISGQGGHDRTYAAATAMVHGFCLDEEAAFGLMMSRFNPRCKPPWSGSEIRHKVRDAAKKQHRRPYGWLRDAAEGQSAVQQSAVTAVDRPANGKTQDARDLRSFPCTDLGNAERFACQHAADIRYCHGNGKWYIWDGRRWKIDDAGTPIRLAGETVRSIYKEAVVGEDEAVRTSRANWAIKSESRERLEAMAAMARSQAALGVKLSDLDVDPWLFNVENGTIDLRTGLLSPHKREDLITHLAPVRFDPNARCPRFDQFLHTTFGGDIELIEFMQRLLGMCLTGITTEQILPIFYGQGANGKSVLIDTFKGLMGSYAADAPPGLLTETRLAQHPTELADLCGRRLVIASETEQGAAFKAQFVKRLTGDETLKGRFMRQDFFEFPRTHKLILVTNNKPCVREDSEAIWRRAKLILFGRIVPKAERDPNLLAKLRTELPGILAWAVRGCLAFQRDGLGEPTAVIEATDAYRKAEDSIGRFLEERCVTDANPNVRSKLFAPWSLITTAYEAWCQETGEPSVGGHRLGMELEKRGFMTTTRRHGGKATKGRAGLGLRDHGDLPASRDGHTP